MSNLKIWKISVVLLTIVSIASSVKAAGDNKLTADEIKALYSDVTIFYTTMKGRNAVLVSRSDGTYDAGREGEKDSDDKWRVRRSGNWAAKDGMFCNTDTKPRKREEICVYVYKKNDDGTYVIERTDNGKTGKLRRFVNGEHPK